MQQTVKMTLNGKTFRKLASEQNIYEFERRGCSDLSWGYIHICYIHVHAIYMYMYMTFIVKQVYWYISRITGERLQDHWSSGLRHIGKQYSRNVILQHLIWGCFVCLEDFHQKMK